MNRISVLDFWEKYSEGVIHFKQHPELPLKINLNLFFNTYFGRLCVHHFDRVEKNHAKLTCTNCIHIHQNSLAHICDSHIGIVKGQIEKITSPNLLVKRIWENNVCHIAFDANEE